MTKRTLENGNIELVLSKEELFAITEALEDSINMDENADEWLEETEEAEEVEAVRKFTEVKRALWEAL